jgi:hypothetical protein
MVRLDESPKQNRMLSIILLFPEPLGPDTVVNPGRKGMLVVPVKDLKLWTSSCSIYTWGQEALTRVDATKHIQI